MTMESRKGINQQQDNLIRIGQLEKVIRDYNGALSNFITLRELKEVLKELKASQRITQDENL